MKDEKDLTCEEILDEFRSQCSRSCKKDGSCIKFIQLYLDNMACKSADKYFLDGIKNCGNCSEYFKINDCIKTNLRSKASEITVPVDLELRLKECIKA
jgi:hypothetical protein